MKLNLRKSKSPPVTGRHRLPRASGKPAAFSYHSQRSERTDGTAGRQEPSNKPAKASQRPRAGFKKTGFVVAATLLLAVTWYALRLSASPHVVLLGASSNQYFLHPTASYQQAAAQDLASSFWNRNKVTVNTVAVSNQLKQQFPEVAAVSFVLPAFGQVPTIYLVPTQPSFTFVAANGSFIINDRGKALIAAETVPIDSKLALPVITDQTGLHVKAGQNVLSSGDASFIITVLAELQAKQITVGKLVLPPSAEELDIYPSGQSYYVKFNMHTSSDARQQAGTFLAVQAQLTNQHITPTQYIDARIDGRAYYQ